MEYVRRDLDALKTGQDALSSKLDGLAQDLRSAGRELSVLPHAQGPPGEHHQHGRDRPDGPGDHPHRHRRRTGAHQSLRRSGSGYRDRSYADAEVGAGPCCSVWNTIQLPDGMGSMAAPVAEGL